MGPAAPLGRSPPCAMHALCRGHHHENGMVGGGEHPHEAGERLQGHQWHAELPVPTCPCSGSLSPPQLAASVRVMPPRFASPPGIPQPPTTTLLRPPAPWGHGAAAGGVGRSGRCNASMRLGFFPPPPPPPIHARKNYSRPGICSGRVELKSLSWAWQTSRRSRQLFQGQPWRLQSSKLTLQGEEPCAAGAGPGPL